MICQGKILGKIKIHGEMIGSPLVRCRARSVWVLKAPKFSAEAKRVLHLGRYIYRLSLLIGWITTKEKVVRL
ncbi:hypothetical protein C3E97_022410 [Pseudomonas sp. MWU12-2115]|nr:hypothetical protein C3E97_022410 [Pseudomonas sp. MWU12-2115]